MTAEETWRISRAKYFLTGNNCQTFAHTFCTRICDIEYHDNVWPLRFSRLIAQIKAAVLASFFIISLIVVPTILEKFRESSGEAVYLGVIFFIAPLLLAVTPDSLSVLNTRSIIQIPYRMFRISLHILSLSILSQIFTFDYKDESEFLGLVIVIPLMIGFSWLILRWNKWPYIGRESARIQSFQLR